MKVRHLLPVLQAFAYNAWFFCSPQFPWSSILFWRFYNSLAQTHDSRSVANSFSKDSISVAASLKFIVRTVGSCRRFGLSMTHGEVATPKGGVSDDVDLPQPILRSCVWLFFYPSELFVSLILVPLYLIGPRGLSTHAELSSGNPDPACILSFYLYTSMVQQLMVTSTRQHPTGRQSHQRLP